MKKKINYFRIILLVIIASITIFQSLCATEVINHFSEQVIFAIRSFFENIDLSILTEIVRKLAQFFLYVIFGTVVYLNINNNKYNNRDKFNRSMLVMVFIALIDEFFQGIVGKSISIFDVLYSALAGIFGTYICYLTKK